MSDLPNVSTLINRVSTRLRISAIGRAVYRSFLWVGGLYLLVLLVSRLTGVLPTGWFSWQSVAAVPVVALLLGCVFHKRPTIRESARQIDIHANSKDLFLTVSKLETSAGGYQELVKRDAEVKSTEIEPATVVPYRWSNRLTPVLTTVAALFLTLYLIPQLDPFGKVEAAEAKNIAAEHLISSKKATAERAKQLKKDSDSLANGSEAEKELKKLVGALKKMQPRKLKKASQEKILVNHKQKINKLFNTKNTKQLREMLSKQVASQMFGGKANEKAKEWLEEMKEGKSDKLLAEMSDIQEELKELAETKDPVEKAKKARELKKRMQDLANFASNKANSKQLAQALERAMEQMESGQENSDISEEAMQAAMESLELSKAETENLAQAAKELKNLEEALKAIQMARQLNGEERLDGSESEGMDSLEDYAELYAELMGEGGEGQGEGGSGEGQGEGGPPAEENDDEVTDFKEEESMADLQAGKNILSWTTKGVTEAGEFKKEVANSISTVKQGVPEAIKKEQVPPGYVDGIKKYFDNIEEAADGEASAKAGGTGGE